MPRRIAAIVGALALLLGGCAQPTKQYVNADALGMYFALPRDWVSVPGSQLETAQQGWNDDAGRVFGQTVRWQGAWGIDGVKPADVFAAKPSSAPTVFAFVRDLLDVEQRQVGEDVATALQDIVMPASSLVAAGVDISTQEWRKNRFIGIRQTATYPAGGGRSTTDVVSMLSPDKTRLYSIVLRCSEQCFDANRPAFAAIMQSLTFEETSGN